MDKEVMHPVREEGWASTTSHTPHTVTSARAHTHTHLLLSTSTVLCPRNLNPLKRNSIQEDRQKNLSAISGGSSSSKASPPLPPTETQHHCCNPALSVYLPVKRSISYKPETLVNMRGWGAYSSLQKEAEEKTRVTAGTLHSLTLTHSAQ